MAVSSMLSKQPFGADVINRISAVMRSREPRATQKLAHASLSELVEEVCDEAGIDLSTSGSHWLSNATMTHLALGIDPEPLGVAPFILSAGLPEILATDLGLSVHRGERLCSGRSAPRRVTSPGFASGMNRDARVRLFIDTARTARSSGSRSGCSRPPRPLAPRPAQPSGAAYEPPTAPSRRDADAVGFRGRPPVGTAAGGSG
jgi:hypothetical protein